MTRRRTRRSARSIGARIGVYGFLTVYAILILYPLFFVVMSSLKSNEEIFLTPWALPASWDFGVYLLLWRDYDIGIFLANTVYYTAISMTITIFICSMAAYALIRLKWRLKTVAFGLILFGLMVPIHSQLVPLYVIMTRLGLRNPRFALVAIFVAFSVPVTTFVLSGFIRAMPRELEESAVIEGSTIIGAFFRIILPIMKPALATVAILIFISVWNDFFAGLVFISAEADKTLQLGISRFRSAFAVQYSLLLAAVVIAVIPSMLMYAIMQNRIIEGVTAGAVKG